MVTIINTGRERALRFFEGNRKPIEILTKKQLQTRARKHQEKIEELLLEIANLQRQNEILKAKIFILMKGKRQHSFKNLKIGSLYRTKKGKYKI